MISFKRFFKQKMTHFFTILFACLLILTNISFFIFSSIQYQSETDRQKSSLLEMMQHLIVLENVETSIIYVEHYDHTHGVSIAYYDTVGNILYESTLPPESTTRLPILASDGTLLGEITIDYKNSVFGSELTMGLFILNGVSILIFLGGLFVLFKYLNAQYRVLNKDLNQIGKDYQDFAFLDIKSINQNYLNSLNTALDLKDLQAHYAKTIAHDIKTPLTVMKTYLEGIQSHRLEFNSKINKDILEEIQVIEQLIPQFFISDVTQIQKIQNIAPIVKEQIDKLEEVFLTKRISVEEELGNLEVMISTVDMKRIIEHLLFNSFYYSPIDSKIIIKINPTNKELTVVDQGIGMSDETIRKIKEGPYRSTEASQFHQKGSGMGLQIVFEIMNRIHASIEIDSQINYGTKFTIHFE